MTDLFPSGRLHIPTTAPAGRWWWSDGLFALHGMAAGDVVPTQEVLVSHVHPDDRPTVLSVLGRAYALDTREPHSCEYRLRDLRGRERLVVLTVGSDEPTTGVISGTLVDVTHERHRAVALSVNTQLTLALEAHAAIDQAKGILMLAFGMDGDAAFTLLQSCSQRLNTRLRILADRLVEACAEVDTDLPDHGELVDVLVSLLQGDLAGGLRTLPADGSSRAPTPRVGP